MLVPNLTFLRCEFAFPQNQLIVAGYDFFPLRVDKDGDDWVSLHPSAPHHRNAGSAVFGM